MRTLALTLLWVLIACFPVIADATVAYEYAHAAVDALTIVEKAASVQIKPSGKQGSVAAMNFLLKNAVAQSHAYSQASARLNQFSKSDNDEIRQSVSLIVAALAMLQATSEKTATVCEEFLNNPRQAGDAPGTTMRKVYELEEQAKSNWEVYAQAGAVVSFPLTDSARLVDGKLHYLTITQAEREKLKAQLLQAFGPTIKAGVDKNRSFSRVPAALLWAFLNDKWESADGIVTR